MNEQTIQEVRRDPAAFRRHLRLDDGRPWVLDPWQDRFFRDMDAGWQRAIGRDVPGGFSRGWSIRPRGHSKTQDIATMICWATFAAPPERPVRGVVAAGDEDQARLEADAVRRIVHANGWLRPFIDVQRGRIVNAVTGSETVILSSDAPTSMGLLVDFIICDELNVWRSRDLWDSLFSTAAKKPNALLASLGNAGFLKTWQGDLWAKLQTDPAWLCHSLPGPVASWINPAALAEQKRVLPPVAYARLWGNEWSSGAGDALDPDDLRACVVRPGPAARRQAAYEYVCGLDLSSSRDHSALVVLGCDSILQKLFLADCRSWAPIGGRIDLDSVRSTTLELSRRFNAAVFFDPHEASLMTQDLALCGVYCEPVPFVGSNLNKMASALIQTIRERKIELYNDERLLDDLQRLTIVEKSYGFKLEATRDQNGHADRATALAICLPAALEKLRFGGIIDGTAGAPVEFEGIFGGRIPAYQGNCPNPFAPPGPGNLPGFGGGFGGSISRF